MKESIDPIWEELHSQLEWGQYPSEHVIRFIARNYYKTDRSKVRILDFGAGAGAHTWYLAREGFDTYAFDGSKSAINKIKRRLDKEGLEAHLSVMDGVAIDYPEELFDAVVDNLCIYANTLSNIKIMYENVYKVLKRGGQLLTVCFSKETTGFGLGDEVEKDTFRNITEGNLMHRGTTHFFDIHTLNCLLDKIGFRNIHNDIIMYTDNDSKIEHIITIAVK